MSIKKQYLKKQAVCKVTFCLPREAARSANQVYIVGEFNDWNVHATPMKKLKTATSP